MDLQHHHNNYTTPPHMEVGSSVWSPSHMRGCCTIVVPVKCRNQTPMRAKKLKDLQGVGISSSEGWIYKIQRQIHSCCAICY